MSRFEKMELLAPAGGREQLEYAIRFGADAIYLAADRFGMRQRATNFALEDIAGAVAYAHDHETRVYVTLNTIMHDNDIDALAAYMRTLAAAHIDAFIIGDLGAARLARELVPEVRLHVSTQANVSNALAARVWHELGASRIVCAREMSVQQIAALRAAVPDELELEVFVHGAMCMAYSGRCLISDYLTGRSALTGHCTQSCRWSYTLEEEKRPGEHFPIEEDANGTYIMNAQDLNMLAHLDDLHDAGVDSIKIEGRNKKAFYVATVVNAYRSVLDGAPAEAFAHELDIVSHRPYSTGFFYGPAHQATTTDERVWMTEWAAEVMDAQPLDDGSYRIEVRCRNAFGADMPLEALAPGSAARPLAIRDLQYTENGISTPVERANRNMERYSFTCDESLDAQTIIRMPKA